jgi:O-antigen/teichoic acid export membrane protein
VREDLPRLARGTAIYGVGGLVTRFISFFLLPVFTAYLTPADYGISSMLVFLSFVLTPLFSLGLGTSLGICYFDDAQEGEGRKSTAVWTAFLILLASSSVMVILGSVYSREISLLLFQSDEYGYFVILSVMTTCAGVLTMPFMLYLQFEERAKLFVVLSTLSAIISVSISLFMVVALRGGIKGYIEAGLISQAVSLGIFLFPAGKLKIRFAKNVARELLRHGVPMIPSFLCLFVLQQGNRYALQYYDGIESVGLYTVGYSIGMVMNLLANAFTSAWTPYFLSFMGKEEEARKSFGRVLTYYTFGFGTVSLLFYVFAKPVILVMTQPAFLEAYKVIGLSATASFLTGMFSLFLPGVYFAKEVKFVSLLQGVSAVTALVLFVLLIPPFGIVGAALSLVLGTLLMSVLMHCWNVRRRSTYLKIEYEWGRLLVYAVLYVGCAGLLLVERSFATSWELVLSVVVSAVLIPAVYLLLDDTEKEVIRRYMVFPRHGT